MLLGRAMLFGRERERLERWNELIEKRRFFLSSFELSVSKRVRGFSGVVVIEVAVRDVVVMTSGSSEASREEVIESDRE